MYATFRTMVTLTLCALVFSACSDGIFEPGMQPGAVLANVRGVAAFAPANTTTTTVSASRTLALADSTLSVGDTTSIIVRAATVQSERVRTRALRTSFRSRDTTVATVSVNGIVTIRRLGVATIIAESATSARDSITIGVALLSAPEARSLPDAPPAPEVIPEVPNNAPPGDAPATPGARAELPRDQLPMPSMPVLRTVRVAAGQNLQAALDAALPGDELVLDAGATYRGSFILPKKSGSGWITIRSSASTSLPAGVRVRPSNASAMPKLIPAHWNESAIRTAEGASRYRLVGLELMYDASMTGGGALMSLGSADNGEQLTLAAVPSDIVVERMYIHGHSNVSFYRCIALNSARTIVVDSYLSECHASGTQAQAIAGWNGPGPYRIENNFLEGSGQNVFFGGNDPSIRNLTPSDIVIRRNHFFTPKAWASKYVIFAQLEFKNAARVLVENNVFDFDGNDPFSQLYKSVNQSGTAPWSVTKDLTVQFNHIKNAGGGFNIAGKPESQPTVYAHRITVENNLIENISRIAVQLAEVDDLSLSHNTWSGTAQMGLVLNGNPMNRFGFSGNVIGTPGAQVRSDFGFGQVAIERHSAAGRVVAGNAFVGGLARDLPTGSAIFGSLNAIPNGYGVDRTRVLDATRNVVQP